MQRSRRALLQRRAAAEVEKKVINSNNGDNSRRLYYKVSVSVVLISWGFILLLNSFISHGNGYRDEPGVVAGESSWHEAQQNPNEVSHSGDVLAMPDVTSSNNVQNAPIVMEAVKHNAVVLVGEDKKASISTSEKELTAEEISGSDIKSEREAPLKSDRLSRVAPPLDEFKSRAVAAKEKTISSQTGTVVHRVEPGGTEYNYASANKGAKVLAFNKEAKGASNILEKDKDKYLRNPCSVEEKYVVIELSEETLVDSIEIANFEHYSSNLKNFELLSSLTYPTDNWVKLGNFTAQNVKHAQRFTLPEPKWVRYLKLNLLNHYGSEFYCTLSAMEVYGVDAVERMLEDLISVENNRLEPEEQNIEHITLQEPADGGDLYQKIFTEVDDEPVHESQKPKKEVPKVTVHDPVIETKPQLVGRMPGDTVLKILMQKVQSLDVNFSVLERYLEELNSRYSKIFKEFDDDMDKKDLLLEKIRLDIKNLQISKDTFAKTSAELLSWKSEVSSQLGHLANDNALLRSEFERLRDHEDNMEKKGFAVIFISFLFGCLAAAKLFIGILLSIFRIHNSVNFYRTSSAWLVLLLSSSTIALILML